MSGNEESQLLVLELEQLRQELEEGNQLNQRLKAEVEGQQRELRRRLQDLQKYKDKLQCATEQKLKQMKEENLDLRRQLKEKDQIIQDFEDLMSQLSADQGDMEYVTDYYDDGKEQRDTPDGSSLPSDEDVDLECCSIPQVSPLQKLLEKFDVNKINEQLPLKPKPNSEWPAKPMLNSEWPAKPMLNSGWVPGPVPMPKPKPYNKPQPNPEKKSRIQDTPADEGPELKPFSDRRKVFENNSPEASSGKPRQPKTQAKSKVRPEQNREEYTNQPLETQDNLFSGGPTPAQARMKWKIIESQDLDN